MGDGQTGEGDTARRGLGASIRRSAVLAAVLSAVIPGAGQLWAGAPRRALIVALPFLVIVAAGIAAAVALATGALSVDDVAGLLLRPDILAAIVVVDLVLLLYRAGAIVDAWIVAKRRWPGVRGSAATAVSIAVLVAIVAGNVGIHAGVAYLDQEVASAGESILAGNDPGDALLPPDDPTVGDDDAGAGLLPSPGPGDGDQVADGDGDTAGDGSGMAEDPSIDFIPDPVAAYLPPPPGAPPSWSIDHRLDVLLMGVDAGPGRWSLRTDTMILLSVDTRTGSAAMFGIPRNMVNVPLPKESRAAFPACKCYPQLLNSLYVYAVGHPKAFPGGDNRGFRAVAGAVETLTGVDLDGMAIIDLNGFVKLVDVLGGLRITVASPVYDRFYPKPDGTGDIHLNIKAGRQKMNGFTALAYARSRHQSSDYGRMKRQQEVLIALRKQVKPCTVIPRLPKLLKALKGTVTTTFKPDQLPDLLRLADQVDSDHVSRYSLSPPTYPEHLSTADWKRVRTLVTHVFDKARTKAEKKAPTDPAITTPTVASGADDPCA